MRPIDNIADSSEVEHADEEPRFDEGDRAVAESTYQDAGETDTDTHIDTLLAAFLRLARELGHPTSEAELRATIAVPRTGMTIDLFYVAVSRMGYRVRRAPLKQTNAAQFPTPFVLLGGPDVGAQVVLDREGDTFTVFSAVTGTISTLSVKAAATLAANALVVEARPPWRRLVTSRIKSILWQLIFASLIINLFALATPLFVMTVYNKVIGQQALETLDVLVIGMVIIYGFELLLRAIRGYVSSHTGARIDALVGGESFTVF